MAEILKSWSVIKDDRDDPTDTPTAGIGYIIETDAPLHDTGTVMAFEGWNNSDDFFQFGSDLLPGDGRLAPPNNTENPTRINIPPPNRPACFIDAEGKWAVTGGLGNPWKERAFARPTLGSPTVASVTDGEWDPHETAHNMTLPATVDAGDLLLTEFILMAEGGDWSADPSSTPSGWTKKFNDGGYDTGDYYCFAIDAVGDEDEDVISFDTTGADPEENWTGAFCLYRITGWIGDLAEVEVSSGDNDFSDTPDPDSLTYSGGSGDHLWIAVGAFENDSDTVTAPGSGWTFDYYNLNSAATWADCGLGYYYQAFTSTVTVNPPTYTIDDGAEGWVAWTIVVPEEAAAVPLIVPRRQLTTVRM